MSIIKYFDDEDEGGGAGKKCGYCKKEVLPVQPHTAIPDPENPGRHPGFP